MISLTVVTLVQEQEEKKFDARASTPRAKEAASLHSKLAYLLALLVQKYKY